MKRNWSVVSSCLTRAGTEEDRKILEKKREDKAKKKEGRKSKRDYEEEDENEGSEWEKVKRGVPLVKVRHCSFLCRGGREGVKCFHKGGVYFFPLL